MFCSLTLAHFHEAFAAVKDSVRQSRAAASEDVGADADAIAAHAAALFAARYAAVAAHCQQWSSEGDAPFA